MVKSIENVKKIAIKIDSNINISTISNLIQAINIFTINNNVFFILLTKDLKIKSLVNKKNKNIIIEEFIDNENLTYSDFKNLNKINFDYLLSFDDNEYFEKLINENNKLNNKNEILKRGKFFKNEKGIVLISDFNKNYSSLKEIEDSFSYSFLFFKKITSSSHYFKKDTLKISYLTLENEKDETIENLLNNLNEYQGIISFKNLFNTPSNFLFTDSSSLTIINDVMEGLIALNIKNLLEKKRTLSDYFSKLFISFQKEENEDINNLLLKIKLIFSFPFLIITLPSFLETNDFVKLFRLINDIL